MGGQLFSAVLLRQELEKTLPEGVQWTDFHKVLKLCEPKHLEEAMMDRKQFYKRLQFEIEWPPTRYWVIAQLRPVIEERLVKMGGLWDEVVPFLEQYDIAFEL